METFQNQTVLVTGAGSGIGFATCRALLDAGARVIGVDRDPGGLERLADPDTTSGRLRTTVVDLTDQSARDELVSGIDELHGLVNAAGIIKLAPLADVTVADFRAVQSVNLEAPFFLMQALAPRLTDGGAVVNLASTAGKTGTTLEAAPYAASKAGLMSLTRAFATALAPRGITVNAICPGVIDTPMQEAVQVGIAAARNTTVSGIVEQRAATVPLGRSGTPDEVAFLIRWLLGPESRYITGQAINVCGGLVTW